MTKALDIPIDTIPAVLEGVTDAAEWAARGGASYADVLRAAEQGWRGGEALTPLAECGWVDKLGRRVPTEEMAP